jgi:adenylate cyclase
MRRRKIATMFSLERRFLILLLLPVALILIVGGVAGFLYLRDLRDLWGVATRLKLEKAVHQIQERLEEKMDLVRRIEGAEEIPGNDILRTYLIQQLRQTDGVRFVDLEPADSQIEQTAREGKIPEAFHGSGSGNEATQAREFCSSTGFCAQIMDINSPDKTLTIVKFMGRERGSPKRLIVKISLDFFLKPVKEVALSEGGTACLVTDTGHLLAQTDNSWSGRTELGEKGHEAEEAVLRDMKHKKNFGSEFGKGHLPELMAGFYRMPFIDWYVVLFSKGDAVMAPIARSRFCYALAGLAAQAVILVLIRLITRSVGRSVAEISAATMRAEKGDYTTKLPEEKSDEIGRLNRTFNHMIERLKQRDLIEQTFSRYVDKNVAAELIYKPEALRLGGEKRIVTIMMSDLRNFTAISEKLQPEEVIKMLNKYFARMIAVIECYKGIIVDFYGDSILVFFNGMVGDSSMSDLTAVKCALEMQRELEGFVTENLAQGLPALSMGIGIHTAEVIVGNIGTETRAKYGIVGSGVNLTDRIQNAAAGGKVVISKKTYETIADKLEISQQFAVCLKGVEENHTLYEIRSIVSHSSTIDRTEIHGAAATRRRTNRASNTLSGTMSESSKSLSCAPHRTAFLQHSC